MPGHPKQTGMEMYQISQHEHTVVQASEATAAANEEAASLARGQLEEAQRALSERMAAWSAEKAALVQQQQTHAAVCCATLLSPCDPPLEMGV